MDILQLITEPGFIIEFIVVIAILILQVKTFRGTAKMMDEYEEIFSDSKTWDVVRDETGQVTSIKGGASNHYFNDIKVTINKYIAGNSNSVMDFQIFKDAVDRQCNLVENQIESQIPIPLYLGLAGTMIGIIAGLLTLVFSNNFTSLLAGKLGAFNGIGSLLLAVAIAMVASLCGILMTTRMTNQYKDKSSNEEEKRNAFISWMQSTLFPSLPNDISLAITQMVDDLEDFNDKFEKNTENFSHSLEDVNKRYKEQEDLIKAVKDMDVQSMAIANVKVLKELEKCTEKLALFNQYLNDIKGYTETIQKFNDQFNQEETQLGLLREIRDFFKTELEEVAQRKKVIGDAVSAVDLNLKKSFKELEDHNSEHSEAFKNQLEEQTTQYKKVLKEQQDNFDKAYQDMQNKLVEKLNNMPALLDKINDIPDQIKSIAESTKALTLTVQNSMSDLTRKFEQSLAKVSAHPGGAPVKVEVPPVFTKKEKVIGAIMLIVITLSSLGAATFCFLSFINK